MLQYLLTGLAGIALGIVGMRVWQLRDPAGQEPGTEKSPPLAGASDAGAASAPSRTRMLLIAAGALAALAVVLLLVRRPESALAPAGQIAAGTGGGQQLSDVETMIAKLADRLAKTPDDGEGFRMLGWSYVMTGHPDKAIEPYRRAKVLLPARADVHAGLGEALVGVAKGTVTDEAKAAFDKAISLDPREPRARFFLAQWRAQHGQEKEALEEWIALANDGPAEAPWQSDLRRQIAETSARLGVDVSARLKTPVPQAQAAEPPPIDPAAVKAASQLPAADRQAMVDRMVEGLAAKLKANPKDVDGWIKLLRSRMVLQQNDQARAELAAARNALATDKGALAKLNAAAAELGVPGAL